MILKKNIIYIIFLIALSLIFYLPKNFNISYDLHLYISNSIFLKENYYFKDQIFNTLDPKLGFLFQLNFFDLAEKSKNNFIFYLIFFHLIAFYVFLYFLPTTVLKRKFGKTKKGNPIRYFFGFCLSILNTYFR